MNNVANKTTFYHQLDADVRGCLLPVAQVTLISCAIGGTTCSFSLSVWHLLWSRMWHIHMWWEATPYTCFSWAILCSFLAGNNFSLEGKLPFNDLEVFWNKACDMYPSYCKTSGKESRKQISIFFSQPVFGLRPLAFSSFHPWWLAFGIWLATRSGCSWVLNYVACRASGLALGVCQQTPTHTRNPQNFLIVW